MNHRLSYWIICILVLCRDVRLWRIVEPDSDDAIFDVQSRSPDRLSERMSSDKESSLIGSTVLRSCIHRIEKGGVYQIRGNAYASPMCYVYFKAPVAHKIRFILKTVKVDCDTSGFALLDGWQTIGVRQAASDTIPSHNEPKKRELFFCSSNDRYRQLETSQNIGQLRYSFRRRTDLLVFEVVFVPDSQVCDNYVDDRDEPTTLTLRVDRPRNCRIYVSGGARLRLTELQLDQIDQVSKCGSSFTNYISLQTNSTSWNPAVVQRKFYDCDVDFSDFRTPCLYNILELHATTFSNQMATFQIESLPDEDREPATYYCY